MLILLLITTLQTSVIMIWILMAPISPMWNSLISTRTMTPAHRVQMASDRRLGLDLAGFR